MDDRFSGYGETELIEGGVGGTRLDSDGRTLGVCNACGDTDIDENDVFCVSCDTCVECDNTGQRTQGGLCPDCERRAS